MTSSVPGDDVDGLDTPSVPPQQIVGEITDDQIRLASAARHDTADQNICVSVPFDIDSTVAVRQSAVDFSPSMWPAGTLLLANPEAVNFEPTVFSDRVP